MSESGTKGERGIAFRSGRTADREADLSAGDLIFRRQESDRRSHPNGRSRNQHQPRQRAALPTGPDPEETLAPARGRGSSPCTATEMASYHIATVEEFLELDPENL